MPREDVLKFWRARPFRPFRIITVVDEPIDVMHPRLMIAGGEMISVGAPHPTEPPPMASDVTWLGFDDIARIEVLHSPAVHVE